MKVIVVHLGALRNYAIPSALAREGVLEAFYTDLCADRGFGKLARMGTFLPVLGGRLSRLANRKLPRNIIKKTHTFDAPSLWGQFLELFANDPTELIRARQNHWSRTGAAMVTHGFGNATHILSVFGHGHSLLIEARRQGIKVISDVNIALSSPSIIAREQRSYPSWPQELDAVGAPGFPELMLAYTDLFLCPSQFVQRDLVDNFSIPEERTRIVPYSVHDRWFTLESRPQPGRILFAGGAVLRKGAHYYSMSAEILRERGREYSFILAGHASRVVREFPECGEITFLGRVARADIPNEFIKADVLVLPSLAEGSAGVTYEALGAGLPIVTTYESGSVVRDGVEGFIVPSRDPVALANAIERIVEDRALRENMSRAARKRAQDFCWERYQERLIAAIADA
ncbi:glycosyltransferase family 4 protein [Pseudorhodoplanes sp.]|uniref:glycosyltransferase family 4 protein n=1 Tax=Pseudorhodoplanes sp. TaxID=1934341 RepID=UPI003D0DFC46